MYQNQMKIGHANLHEPAGPNSGLDLGLGPFLVVWWEVRVNLKEEKERDKVVNFQDEVSQLRNHCILTRVTNSV